jgi:hypothetical protein
VIGIVEVRVPVALLNHRHQVGETRAGLEIGIQVDEVLLGSAPGHHDHFHGGDVTHIRQVESSVGDGLVKERHL